MSTFDGRGDLDERASAAETVAGFLAAASITLSAIAVVYRPVRLIPFALVVAFVAVALGGRHSRLAAFAVAAAAVAWLAGMIVAVVVERPLY